MPSAPSAADEALRLDNQLCFALYATSLAITRLYKPLLDAMGLTYPQYLVMLALWERDGVTVSDLCDRLGLETGTLTPLLKRLESAGRISRLRDTGDERRVRVQLTANGRALRRRAAEVPGCLLAATQCPISELVQLRRQVQALRQQISA